MGVAITVRDNPCQALIIQSSIGIGELIVNQ